MNSYLPLLIVPLLCVPMQHLYLFAGRRYDLAAITYIATGTFITTFFSDPAARPRIQGLLSILIVLSLVVYVARCFVLAYGSPKDFTLFTFCQLWAIPAVVGYEIGLQSADGANGIYIHTFHHLGLTIAAAALVAAVFVIVLLGRSSTALRLVVFTESPLQYRLLFGSPLHLAWRVETCAVFTYVLAGVAFRFVISDLSGAIFGTESVWCLLCAAVIVRKWQKFLILGPLLVTYARMLINQVVDSKYSQLSVYFLIAVCLAIVNSNTKRASRETSG